MLTEKCHNQEAVISELELREQEYGELEGEADLLRQQVESSRDELQKLAKDNELQEDDLIMVKKDLVEERKRRQRVEKVIKECAESLKVALSVSWFLHDASL